MTKITHKNILGNDTSFLVKRKPESPMSIILSNILTPRTDLDGVHSPFSILSVRRTRRFEFKWISESEMYDFYYMHLYGRGEIVKIECELEGNQVTFNGYVSNPDMEQIYVNGHSPCKLWDISFELMEAQP